MTDARPLPLREAQRHVCGALGRDLHRRMGGGKSLHIDTGKNDVLAGLNAGETERF